MVMRHQPVKGRLRPRLQLADQLGFISAPREGARPIGHALPFFSLPQLRAKDELAFFGRTPCRSRRLQPLSAPTIRHHRERSGSRLKPIVASCAPRRNGATVMDRARLFPAADRLPVVPSELRSKGTRREALPGLISGTFLLALSGERRALWSVRCPDYLQAIPHHRFTAR